MHGSVWTTYGIKAKPAEGFEMHSLKHLARQSSKQEANFVVDALSTPSPSSPSDSTSTPNQALTIFAPADPAAPAAFSIHPAPSLSAAAIAGICTGVGVLVFLVVYAVLEIFVLRERRRDKALRKSVEEIERGPASSAEVAMEGKMQLLLQEDEEEVWGEDGDGRMGMSLPRRVWW
ncbi:hypothetical protein EJ07DRAFT_155545 [Lizonia empirigonia]|nr:hypothetical protein EJ07DRAFT_155545 [Lizonia empirigonia]